MDDGIEHKHPDLKQNYYAPASYDVNDGDWNPAPRYDRLNTNRHGTRCAGVVSAKAGNSICIPGIAHKSKIGGIRMLDGNVNDLVEAQSIGFGNDKIDIYVGSWGPPDDGATLEGPGYYTSHAFKRAVKYGRKNKGNIYRVVRIKQAFQEKNLIVLCFLSTFSLCVGVWQRWGKRRQLRSRWLFEPDRNNNGSSRLDARPPTMVR